MVFSPRLKHKPVAFCIRLAQPQNISLERRNGIHSLPKPGLINTHLNNIILSKNTHSKVIRRISRPSLKSTISKHQHFVLHISKGNG